MRFDHKFRFEYPSAWNSLVWSLPLSDLNPFGMQSSHSYRWCVHFRPPKKTRSSHRMCVCVCVHSSSMKCTKPKRRNQCKVNFRSRQKMKIQLIAENAMRKLKFAIYENFEIENWNKFINQVRFISMHSSTWMTSNFDRFPTIYCFGHTNGISLTQCVGAGRNCASHIKRQKSL